MRQAKYDPGPRREAEGYANAPPPQRTGSPEGSEAANGSVAVCKRSSRICNSWAEAKNLKTNV